MFAIEETNDTTLLTEILHEVLLLRHGAQAKDEPSLVRRLRVLATVVCLGAGTLSLRVDGDEAVKVADAAAAAAVIDPLPAEAMVDAVITPLIEGGQPRTVSASAAEFRTYFNPLLFVADESVVRVLQEAMRLMVTTTTLLSIATPMVLMPGDGGRLRCAVLRDVKSELTPENRAAVDQAMLAAGRGLYQMLLDDRPANGLLGPDGQPLH